MNVYQACCDTSDAIELYLPQSLYLKPIARLHISVQLPQLKVPGKSISNWEVMEKVRNIIKPEQFSSLKVSKSTLEFVRLEAEIENKSKIPLILAKLDARTIKLSGFTDVLKVRAAEAKIPYPTRHMWDSYFRDSKHMNDIKPGERPDTIHICNLPCKWFTDKSSEIGERDLPSECTFKKVFEAFGEIRCVDIPILDPLRNTMKNSTGIQTFYFGQDHSFEGYIQFKEYVCFVKAMTALKGMKLLYKDGDKAWTANIKVDFDRTKHLSDESINRRTMEREKILQQRKLIKEEEEERKKREEACKKKLEDEVKMARENQLAAEKERKQKEIEVKLEEQKVIERKEALSKECNRLKCMRLLQFLLDRARVRVEEEINLKKEEESEKIKMEKEEEKKQATEEEDKLELVNKEKELRRKLLLKYKSVVLKKLEREERKINNLIGIKKKMLIDDLSNNAKHCTSLGNNCLADPSAEPSSLPREVGVVAPELPELREDVWKKGYSPEVPLYDLNSEPVLNNMKCVGNDVFQSVSDPNNQLLTKKYIDSLSDFCQKRLNRTAPEVHRSEKSSGKQSDEDGKLLQNKLELKRKVNEREISFSEDLELLRKKKRDCSTKVSK